MRIFKGEFVALFGPSGCGKSTLLNILSGLEDPTSGEVLWKKHNIATFTNTEKSLYHRSNIGMIFQAYNLIRSLSVLDNVLLPALPLKMRHRERLQKAQSLIKRVGLLAFLHRLPAELSGGQQQRIGVARSLINNPKVLVADEPTGNLDTASAQEIMELLRAFHKKGMTIIMVTHNPEQLAYTSRVLYMRDGSLVYEEDRHVQKELEHFKKMYPHISDDRVCALVLAKRLRKLYRYKKTTSQKILDMLERVSKNLVSYDQLVEILRLPVKKNGFGVHHTKAKLLADEVLFTLPATRIKQNNTVS